MFNIQFALPPEGFKRLFYDIETSPNIGFFWQSGYKLNIPPENIIKERAIICICWKWEGQKVVHSVEWQEGCDIAALSAFMAVALEADEIVGHNGDNFDEKWIRTRCLIHGIICPPKFTSLDTLKKARTHFRFNSNKLDYLGQLLLGKGKESVSWSDWVAIVLKNDRDALDKMVAYCKVDVEVLEGVFHKLQPYVTSNSHAGAATGHGRYSCPACGCEETINRGTRYTAAGLPRHRITCTNKLCGKHFTVSTKVLQDKIADDYIKAKRNEPTL